MIENVTSTGIAGIDTLVSLVSNLFGYISFAIGGVFGLYVILIYLRWREARALRRGMEEIRNEIKSIRDNVGILETVSLKKLFEKNGSYEEHQVVTLKKAVRKGSVRKIPKKPLKKGLSKKK